MTKDTHIRDEYEDEFEARLWMNNLMPQIRDNLDTASKVIYQSSNPTS